MVYMKNRTAVLVIIGVLLFTMFVLVACGTHTKATTIDFEKETFTIEQAYAYAESLGYEGTLEEFVAMLSGKDGVDGVGITTLTISADGHLMVTLTNEQIVDCGAIPTVKGDTGETGRGIKSTYVDEDGYLILVYTDNTKEKTDIKQDVHGHEIVQKTIIEKETTCTQTGMTYIICEACGEVLKMVITPAKGHTEVIDEGRNPTCTESGRTEGKHCSVCGEVLEGEEEIVAIGHIEVTDEAVEADCTGVGLTDGKHCSRCGVCLIEQQEIPALGHIFVDGTCTRCGETEGLLFTQNEDNTYSVSAYTGESEVVSIPSRHNGRAVTGIGKSAFAQSPITEISFPAGLTIIEENAFAYSHLTSVVIPTGIARIEEGAFMECTHLGNITLPDTLTYIGQLAFSSCCMDELTLPDSITGIETGAFFCCSELTSIALPEHLTYLGEWVFGSCFRLVEVYNKSSLSLEKNYFCSVKIIYTQESESRLSLDENGFLLYRDATEISLIDYKGNDKTVIIPDGTTEIHDIAFCERNVTSVTVPNSVTKIGWLAFGGEYTSTIDVHFIGTSEQWESISKEGGIANGDCIIDYVNESVLSYGVDYIVVWGDDTQSGSDNFQVARSENVMDAGLNNIIFDITILDSGYQPITFAEAFITVSVTMNGQTVDESLYTIDSANGAISFDDNLLGETVTVTLAPTYGDANNELTFTFLLNDGVNVYTNEELRASYGDLAVHQINVMRNIVAELYDEDYEQGHGKEIGTVTFSDGTELECDIGVPINDYYHGAYTRITDDPTDTMSINGNYFQIDGSKLPYIDNRYDRGASFKWGDGYYISDCQIGIFLYRNASIDPAREGYWDDTLERFITGTLNIDNLLISGNCIVELSTVTQDIDGTPLAKMSSSYLGIVCRGGTITLNNVTVEKTSFGIFSDSGTQESNAEYNVIWHMNDSILRENWEGNFYLFNLTQVNLSNSKLEHTLGGPSIIIHDIPSSKAGDLIMEVNMDYYTASHIDNWVTGQEDWFVYYGQAQIALYIKAMANNTVSSYGMTILDETETKMNLVFYVQSHGSWVNRWDYDIQGSPAFQMNEAVDQYGIITYTEGSEMQKIFVINNGNGGNKMIVGLALYPVVTQP